MKILAALDLSSAATPLLAVAKQYAIGLAAELCLLHVVAPDPAFVGYEPGPQSVRDQVAHAFRREHEALQQLAGELRQAGVKTTALVVQGATSETILKEAGKLGADLILLGSHGHGAMYQLLVGSVSEGVIRKAGLPILLVPTRDDAPGQSPGGPPDRR